MLEAIFAAIIVVCVLAVPVVWYPALKQAKINKRRHGDD